MKIEYRPPGPVAREFLKSEALVRAIRGPVGSGTSSACSVGAVMQMMRQVKQHDGKRRSRGVIFRNTYGELRDTTIKTWTDWFPERKFGRIIMGAPPFRQLFRFGDVESEIYFMALDNHDDVAKLLSLELTWGWGNEAREFPKSIIDAVSMRLRRYPAKRDGGAVLPSLMLDTNSPDEDHWWPIMAGETPPPEWMSPEDVRMLVKPYNWEFFVQPPAMLETRGPDGSLLGYELNPDAENVQNLADGYYEELIQGKAKQWIDVYVRNLIGVDFDGRRVHAHFASDTHVQNGEIAPEPGVPIIVGLDFGLTPAALFTQLVRGQWRALYEIVLDNADATDLANAILAAQAQRFDTNNLVLFGDPSGDNRSQSSKQTPFTILRGKGLEARPTQSNDPEIRRASLSGPLQRMAHGGPGFIISRQGCPVTTKGLEGGWNYPRVGNGYGSEPDKNRYSHPCEALEYALQGGGEGNRVLGQRNAAPKAGNARRKLDPLARIRPAGSVGRRFSGRSMR